MRYYIRKNNGQFLGWDESSDYWAWCKNPVPQSFEDLKIALSEFVTEDDEVTITTNHC